MLPRPLPGARWLWIGVAAVPSLIDYWCDLGEPDGDTASEHIRRLFHTDTPLGKAAFGLCLAGGAEVLWRHIVKEIA